MASFLPTLAITLLLTILSPTPSFAADILDVDGEVLQNGQNYYIIPHSSNKGGLTLTPDKGSSSCPLYVTQDSSPSSSGLPVMVSTLYKIPFVSSEFPVVFSFDEASSMCNQPMLWFVAHSDANDNSYIIVGASGTSYMPTYYYMIVEDGNSKNVYNIKFCHYKDLQNFRLSATQECRDVSILDDGLLAVINEDAPFPVTFKKYSPKIASYVY